MIEAWSLAKPLDRRNWKKISLEKWYYNKRKSHLRIYRTKKKKKEPKCESNIGLTPPIPNLSRQNTDWGLIACQTTRSTKLKSLSTNHSQNNRAIPAENRRGEAHTRTRQGQGSIISEIDATKRQRNGVVTSSSEGEAILPFLSGGGAGWIRLSSSIPRLHTLSLSFHPSLDLRPSASLHLSRFYDALSRGRRSGMR